MKLYQFSRLTDDEQYHTIWSAGIHVDSYTTDNLVINLYVIDNFYCELYYNVWTNKILHKEGFKQGVRLDKYLDKIKI
jgi:hypothetical protein